MTAHECPLEDERVDADRTRRADKRGTLGGARGKKFRVWTNSEKAPRKSRYGFSTCNFAIDRRFDTVQRRAAQF
jgi:hypothetical protein